MSQKLIQAVNNMTVSASYLNTSYEKKFGFKHYGFDCYGGSAVYAQGYGVILATGTDTCYGKFVVVMYFNVAGVGDVVSNYFHLASIDSGLEKGAFIAKDTKLGVMGKTGTYATGIHLHTEMRKYALGQARMLSPFATQHFKKDLTAGWINPLAVTYCKTSALDCQTYATTNDAYINSADKTAKKIS